MELNKVTIEGERGEEILEKDREDQIELMLKVEIKVLSKTCVSDSSQKTYVLTINAMIIFFLKRNKMRLTLDTIL